MRTLVRIAAVAVPLLWLAACDDVEFGNWDRYKEDFHYSYTLPPGGRLSVETMNGSIEISTWEKDSVEINGTKQANSPQALKDTKIDVQPSAGVVAVRTIPPSGYRNGVGARYTIRVPRRVELDRIVSSNGSIHVDDVEGNALLRTSNGNVRSSRTKGNLDIQTSNAGVELVHTGSARIRTSNGSLHVDLTKGALDASTSNSSINARLTDPDPNRPIRLESSNGHVDLATNEVREIRASTSNSSIMIHIPASANARLRARTSNSSITHDFDMNVQMQTKHSLDGTIGSGGPLIELVSSNGSIKILKR